MSAVGKDERALLVLANLTTWSDTRFLWLYEWLDRNAVNVAKVLMSLHYGRIETLTGRDATRDNFVNRIVNLARDPRTRALDVFLHLHGLQGELFFEEGAVATSELADQIRAEHLHDRLRLLYSTACYGASHAHDFVRAGFRIASGSVAVNTI